MDPFQPLVVTVHGINSDGEWQDLVQPILQPHCSCETIRYRAYRQFGALRQFLGPWSLRVVFLCLGALLGTAAGLSAAIVALLGGFLVLMAVLSIWPTPRTWSQELLVLGTAALAGLLVQGLVLSGPSPVTQAWGIMAWTLALGLAIGMEWWTRDYGARALSWQIGGGVLFGAALVVPLVTTSAGQAWNWAAGWVYLGVLAVLVAPWEAAWMRRATIRWFEGRLLGIIESHREGKPEPPPVHIIAHSFGTYLTGMTLRRHAKNGLHVGRVILVGSVLSEAYPWSELANGVGIFGQVRNEVGGRDIVVTLAGCAAWLSSTFELGRAGRRGFAEEQDGPVHAISHPLERCEHCFVPSQEGRRLVHNVKLPTFRHSDAFLVLDRVDAFWLPWLCEREAGEFWDFRWLCVQATIYENLLNQHLVKDRRRFDALKETLRNQLKGRVWSWTQGKRPGVTFGQYVLLALHENIVGSVEAKLGQPLSQAEKDELLHEMADRLDETLDQIRRRVHDGHRLAREIRRQPRSLSAEEKVRLRSLEPVTAVLQVIRGGLT